MAKGKRLTNIREEERGVILTDRKNALFSICFSFKLENNYGVDRLTKDHLKQFQRFLDTYLQQPISLVDCNCIRKPDREDKYKDRQVQHYEVGRKFRIHGIYIGSVFHVIRLDPEHEFHK